METQEERPPMSASAQRDLDRWLTDERREHYEDDIKDVPQPDIDINKPPMMVMRDEWGAEPPYSTQPLNMPVKYVRFTCTGTSQCHQRGDCDAIVKAIQHDAIHKRKIPDIDYNFLIGGDECLIYEGRSWFVDATRPKKLKFLRGNCIDIAFIGCFTQSYYPKIFEFASMPLVKYGLRKKYVSENLEIVGMNDQVVVQEDPPTTTN